MSLKSSVKIVMIGLSVTFILRLVGTLLPSFFEARILAVPAAGIHLMTNAFLVYFFLLFARDYLDRERESLRSAALWAGAGAVINAVANLRFIISMVHSAAIPDFLRDDFVDLIGPLMGFALMLAFFVRFRNRLLPDERPELKRGTRSAVFGYALFILLQAVVLINYYISGTSEPSVIPGILIWFTLPLLIIGFIAILDFYRLFHRYLQWSWRPTPERDRP